MVQLVGVLGRTLPRLGTRRISFILIGISLVAIISLVFTLPNGPDLSQYKNHKFSVSLPKLKSIRNPFGASSVLNPFRQPSRPPPRQKNDTFEESSWWADWHWLVPFSSSLTLDEDRSLLPYLAERTPVYCYYDTTEKKDSETKDAESELLLTWRMAWWAKGFKPVVLSAAEAMNNPNYETLQHMEVDAAVKSEAMRWLAFDRMGGGIMSHYTLVPMGAFEDPLLGFLRRAEYPTLTRWKGLDTALFVGSKAHVSSFVNTILDSDKGELKKTTDLFSIVPLGTFDIDEMPKALASYDASTIEKTYPKIGEAISADRPKGLLSLSRLVNAHLHRAWQTVFSDGIAVLKPFEEHTTELVADAWELAHLLAECPDSPDPASCPPNLPKCGPCAAGSVKVSTPGQYNNVSSLFTVGTVPHPYTLATLRNLRDSIDVSWIRGNMLPRDPWVNTVTSDLLAADVGSGPRVTRLKEAIAGGPASGAHSLWLTPEKEPPADLHWTFGFVLPQNSTVGPEGTGQAGHAGGDAEGGAKGDGVAEEDSTPAAVAKERDILNKALQMVASTEREDVRVRDAVEAWNLADTEAWKFARAFLARRTVERVGWEKEEERYVDGAGSEKGRHTWDRWMDRLEDKLAR